MPDELADLLSLLECGKLTFGIFSAVFLCVGPAKIWAVKKCGRVWAAAAELRLGLCFRLSSAGDRHYLYSSVGPLCHPWENSLFFPTDDMVVPRMKEVFLLSQQSPLAAG